jgi:hypothetical protein
MGISPTQPGWSHLRIQPQPGTLVHAKVALKLPAEKGINLSLNQTATVLTLMLAFDGGMQAKICVPAAHVVDAKGGCDSPKRSVLLRKGGGGGAGKVVKTVVDGRFLCTQTDVVGVGVSAAPMVFQRVCA